ncbi:MAG: hypothetical protein AAGJ35_08795, partial [Myxococcota bacterium]
MICKEDRLNCGGRCIDTENDGQHCGGCGLRCLSGVCQEGRCVLHLDALFTPHELSGTCIVWKGQIKCWGYNVDGRLGYDYRGSIRAPSRVFIDLGGKKAKQIDLMSGIGDGVCVLLEDGTLRCWDYDEEAYLTLFPKRKIEFGRKILQTDATNAHRCVLFEGGDVKCWGFGLYGSLGYGDRKSRGSENEDSVDLQGRKVRQVDTSYYSTCVLLEDGAVNCWGANYGGQLGYGDSIERNKPNLRDVDLRGQKATQITMGEQFTCALLEGGNVQCWGVNRY